MSTGFVQTISGVSLTKNVGGNRFLWNMRHAGAWDKDPKRAFLNGPIVRPGKYIVELTIDGKKNKSEFEILIDPKIINSGIRHHHLKAQEKLALKVRELLTNSKMMAYKLENVTNGPKLNIKNELVTNDGPYPQPMLIDQTRYLASMINRVDQEPGEDAYIRYEELLSQFESLQNALNNLND